MKTNGMTQGQSGLFFYKNRIIEKRKTKHEKTDINSGYLIITMYAFDILVFRSRIRKNEDVLLSSLQPYAFFILTYVATMLSTLALGFVLYQIAEMHPVR